MLPAHKIFTHLALTVGIGASLVASASDLPHVPDRIESVVASAPPVWISLTQAMDHAGHLIKETASPILETLEQYNGDRSRASSPSASSSTGADPCGGVYMSFPGIDHFRPDSSITNMVEFSDDIIVGRISAIGTGFFNGTPASLLQIRIDRLARNSGDVMPIGRAVLVAYPWATTEIEGRTYCTRVPGVAYEPSKGDRVVVFHYGDPVGRDRSILQVDAQRHLIFEHAGRLILPANFNASDSTYSEMSFEQLVTSVTNDSVRHPIGSRSGRGH